MRRRYRIALAILWIFVVLYPNPFMFFVSIERLSNPSLECPLDVTSLPSDPRKIERFVVEYVKYEYDFKVYGVPWYIPEPKEIVEVRMGDCKGRAVLLASILKEKGIAFSFRASPIHFWVDYEGKVQTEFVKKFENPSAAIYSDGKWKIPEVIDLKEYLRVWKEVLWDAMPFLRKILLFSGLILISFDWKVLSRKLRSIKSSLRKAFI